MPCATARRETLASSRDFPIPASPSTVATTMYQIAGRPTLDRRSSPRAAGRTDRRRSRQMSADIVMDPVSISPLEPGWRAVVQHGDDAPVVVVPVIAWG